MNVAKLTKQRIYLRIAEVHSFELNDRARQRLDCLMPDALQAPDGRISGFFLPHFVQKLATKIPGKASAEELMRELQEANLAEAIQEGTLVEHLDLGAVYEAMQREREAFVLGREERRKLITDNKRLKELVIQDALTNLFNRRYFDASIARQIASARRYHHSVSLLMADIDHFKEVNDRHGHAAGDEVLKKMAGVLMQSVRTTDIVCRVGGEEFALLLPQTQAEGALILAERLCRKVSEAAVEIPTESQKTERVGVTMSIGSATFPDKALQINDQTKEDKISEELQIKADMALYEAKRSGRNRVRPWMG
jgi:diguanylate cyclase (GGDEF)-like protein